MDNKQALAQYLAVLRKWWWLLVACTLVASVSSYIGTRQMPRIYQATTTVMVGQSLQKLNPSSNDFYISQQLAQTYSQLIQRRPILTGAAQALGLDYVPSPTSISTRQVPGTQLLEISVRDTDPERARALADEIANQLILLTPSAGETEERRAFVQTQLADLEAKIEATHAEIENEQRKLEAANSARAIQQHQANINALEQKRDSYRSTYVSLLGTVQEATNYVAIMERAVTPTRPISPNVPQTVVLAAAIGFALAMVGAFLIDFMDDTVHSAEDVTRLTGLPLMAPIARIDGGRDGNKLVAHQEPLSPISEAYRLLCTNIRFSMVDKPLFTLLVTSAGPSEGKSVTLSNLAVIFSESGKKVLVIDADLRRPMQHRIFDSPNATGLSDAILDVGNSVMEYVQQTPIPNVYLLAAGQVPPNPAELLASERMGKLLEEIRQHMDIVLLDSPPALVVADAVILGSRVDATLLVADRGQTRRNMIKQVAEELRRMGAKPIGVVLNRAAPSHAGYQYTHYYTDKGGKRSRARRSRKSAQPSQQAKQSQDTLATPPADAQAKPEHSASGMVESS